MNEKQYLRELAKEVTDYAMSDLMDRRRQLWTDHNSFRFTRPLLNINFIPEIELIRGDLRCQDPYYRAFETKLLESKYRMQLDDDYIVEPFLVVPSEFLNIPPEGPFGVAVTLSEKTSESGAAHFSPSIIEEEDLEKIHTVDHALDVAQSQEILSRAVDTFGDSMAIAQDRQGLICKVWMRDISTPLAKMRGLEQIMWDIYDRPEWLADFSGKLQTLILKHLDQVEAAGGFTMVNGQNQAMCYVDGMKPPSADPTAVPSKDLWCFMASQEFTSIGPDDFKQFMFDFQKPIIERYGMSAYGCCEDLTRKIEILKELSNLRRISITPFANLAQCAEQIGSDYIVSWRPNPSTAVARGVDEAFVRKEMQQAFATFDRYGCKFDITLKDNETVNHDPTTLVRYTQIVMDEIKRHYQ